MKKIGWVFLILLGYMILSNKTILQEGFENDDDNCEYRKKRKGKMLCGASELSKWGEPPCNSWEKTKNINDIKKSKPCSSSSRDEVGKCIKEETKVLKGYYPNDFMYEIDYKDYSTRLVESDGEDNDNNDVPRGVHSSFFS
jgi:hypothetical protein